MSTNRINSTSFDEITILAKTVSGSDENSLQALFGMCRVINATFNGLPLEFRMPVANLFVQSFFKVGNKMPLFGAADGLELLQASIFILNTFATSPDIVSQLHELVFYDLVAKLFSLLCKLLETSRQVPKNITIPLLTTKAYIFLGLPGYKFQMPEDVVSFHEAPKEVDPRSSNQGSATKKVRSLTLDPIFTSLENMRLASSSTSSSTANESAEKSALVRRNALNLLCLLLQNSISASVIIAWPVLLSTPSMTNGTGSSNDNWFVLSMILHDPSILARYMACSVVVELLDEGVKTFLAAAQENSAAVPYSTSALSSSFTPYSVQLAGHIREVHRCLIVAALHANAGPDKCPQMAVHVMKALQCLVRITPYHRLRPGLLSEVFKVSASLLRSKDVDVRVACLTVFGEVLANNNAHSLLEMECLVRSCNPPAFSRPLSYCNSPTGSISGAETPFLSNEQVGVGFQPWLLKVATESAAPNSVYSYPVKIESLQLLNALVKNYSKTLFLEAKQLPDIFKFIYTAMYSADPVYLAHVCFVLETIGTQLNEESIGSQLPLNEIVLFWSDTLSNHIFRLLQAPNSGQHSGTLKAALFDALSSIGSAVFDLLPANLRILCTTTPFDFCDSVKLDKSLRASAIRCLGHFVSCKSMQKDRAFVQSCIDTSLRQAKSEPACQCAAAWLLRNALDCNDQTLISDEILLTGINLTLKGPDKAKPHLMTVIWRVLTSEKVLRRSDLVSSAVCDVICKVLNGQVKGPVKLQWNAADGLMEAFSNEKSLSQAVEQYLPQLVEAACNAMVSSPNFRTRITLANALRNFASIRATIFGKQCLTAYYDALTSARQNIKSPSEFKHVDPLVVALWLGFLSWLSKIEDDEVITSWLAAVGVERLESVLHDVKVSFVTQNLASRHEQATMAIQRLEKFATQLESAKVLMDAIVSIQKAE